MARSRILYFYLLLLSFAFFVLFEPYLFHLTFVFFLILPVCSLLAALPNRYYIRCRMESADDIQPKGACTLHLTAENTGLLPCACVRIRMERGNALGRVGEAYRDVTSEAISFWLWPRRVQTLSPKLMMAHCGRVDIRIRSVDVCDMLGLFRIPVVKRNCAIDTGSVYVLPELQRRAIDTEETADLGLDSVTYSLQKRGGDPSEIFQLRDYREGDARNSVHWKLSSRMQRLIVREFGLPLNPSLHFLLELREGASPESMEEAIGSAIAYSEYLMARKVVHCISFLNADGVIETVSVTDAVALARSLHELLALPAQKPWATLHAFAAGETRQADVSLVLLLAGAKWKKDEDEKAERVLLSLMERSVCRRVTLMSDACPQQAAKRFLSLGCRVELYDGRVPGMEAEAAQ